jgi:membrane protein DedA with SNARE-associated domain
MEILDFIYGMEPLIREYNVLFTFFASLFFGEEIILIFSFLSANGYLPLWKVFVFCFLGRIFSDFFFFSLGKFKIVHILKKYQNHNLYADVEKVFSKMHRKNLFVTLLYTKVMIGMRIAIMFYIGSKSASLKKILINDAAAIFVWLIVLLPLGWFAGSSFKFILDVFNDIKLTIFFLIMLVIFGVLINGYIRRKIIQKRAQLLA